MIPTEARLKALLHYDSETGVFRWKVRRGGAAQVGSVAGRIESKGYRQITVDWVAVMEHRLAWFYVTGEWPPYEIDHINGCRTDNRFANLRLATHGQNQQNIARAHMTNRSGLLGVTEQGGRYHARITHDGVCHRLGGFATAEAAHQAYLKAKKSIHTHNERALHHAAI